MSEEVKYHDNIRVSRGRYMSVLRTTGPQYNTQDPIPHRYYQWKCPKCGDISEDPANVRETTCHNGHEIKLTLTEDGGVHEAMVAEYEEFSFIVAWATHNFARERGNKIHLVLFEKKKLHQMNRRAICGRKLVLSQLGICLEGEKKFENWVNGGDDQLCAICLRLARKILK